MQLSKISVVIAAAAGMSVALSSPLALAKNYKKDSITDKVLSEIGKAVSDGRAYADVRYRLENVDQSNFAKDANASTVRTRVGYKTGSYKNFRAGVEFENVSPVGKEAYNDGGSTASDANYPTVADPVGSELNQAYIAYDAPLGTEVTYGRQRVVLGNQRFVGDVGWRQNDQTFDSLTFVNTLVPDTTLIYGYVYNVNSIFGDDDATGDLGSQVHLFDATYKGLPFGKLRAYAYLLEVNDAQANSSDTYGVSFDGSSEISKGIKALYYAEYARQSDAAQNPTNYEADYVHLKAGLSFKGLTIKAGYEVLGSDNGNAGFATPLATLHKFNGWADQFLATPNTGLEDAYISASYKLDGICDYLDGTKLKLAYHDFDAEHGSNEYGDEIDFSITKSFAKYYNVGIKYADYDTNNEGSATNDVRKIIFSFGFKFN